MLKSASEVPEESDCADAVGIPIGEKPIKNKGMKKAANRLRFADIPFIIYRLHVLANSSPFAAMH